MHLFSRIRYALQRLRWRAEYIARILAGLALIGLLLSAFFRDLSQFPSSLTWPITDGEVTLSEFYIDDSFSVDFTYSYDVDGVTYHNDRIIFFEYALFANRVQNERFIEQHPVGTPVQVYYDPRDPSQSVLMRTLPLNQLWSPVLFALCLVSTLISWGVAFFLGRFIDFVRRRAESYAKLVQDSAEDRR